jgi:hypothetical protein
MGCGLIGSPFAAGQTAYIPVKLDSAVQIVNVDGSSFKISSYACYYRRK